MNKIFKQVAKYVKALNGKLKNQLFHNFDIECLDSEGNLRWRLNDNNLIVNTGLDHILANYWKGSAYTASHFVGLLSDAPTVAATDTMAAHAGWTEVEDYAEASRPALTLGSVSGQSVDNVASKATYNVNAPVTIGGSFITTDNTKSGATGVLIGAVGFNGGSRVAKAGDTLNVTVTLSAAG